MLDAVFIVSWPDGRLTYTRPHRFADLPDQPTPGELEERAAAAEPRLAEIGPVHSSEVGEGRVTITFASLYDGTHDRVDLGAWTARRDGEAR